MKRLFQINRRGSRVTSSPYFADKMQAKRERDSLGGPEDGYTIAPGPDHRRYRAPEARR